MPQRQQSKSKLRIHKPLLYDKQPAQNSARHFRSFNCSKFKMAFEKRFIKMFLTVPNFYYIAKFAFWQPLVVTENTHCVKSVQIWSYFWSVFSHIQSECGKIRTRNYSLFGPFSRNDPVNNSQKLQKIFF